jgi:alpha-N-arabinofuranosidase
VKVVNTLATPQEVAFDVKGGKVAPDGTMTLLRHDDLKAMNTIEEPRKIAPVTTPVTGLGASFRRTLPGYSVVVLRMRTGR